MLVDVRGVLIFFFFFQAEDGIRDLTVTGVQTCALPICKFDVLSTGKPWAAPYHHPICQKAQAALEKGFGKKAVFIREGGSIPFVTQMYDTFKVPCGLSGFGLPDENAHAPDEHIALENYFGGITTIAEVYDDLATLYGRAPNIKRRGEFAGNVFAHCRTPWFAAGRQARALELLDADLFYA